MPRRAHRAEQIRAHETTEAVAAAESAAAKSTAADSARPAVAVPACGRLEAALVLIAEHFISVWRGSMRRRRRARERVLGRKDGLCQVPGCTRAAVHSHHIRYRSHGGGEEETNRLALCAAHHLHCLHRGWMRVHKTSDGRLAWELGVCADSVREVRYTAAA